MGVPLAQTAEGSEASRSKGPAFLLLALFKLQLNAYDDPMFRGSEL